MSEQPENSSPSTCETGNSGKKWCCVRSCWQKLSAEAPLVKFGLILFLALCIGAYMLSSAISNRQSNEFVTVTGSTSKIIEADRAVWQLRFSRNAKDVKAAYAQIGSDLKTLQAFLTEEGLSDKNWNVKPLITTTQYVKNFQGYDTSDIDGYKLEQGVTVESDNPKKLEALSQKVSELFNKGLYIESEPPEYYYSKLDDLKIDLIGQATKNAMERGQSIAKNTGRSIGVLRSASVGVFQITAKNSTEVSDYGIYDTSSIEKKVSAVINATFTIR